MNDTPKPENDIADEFRALGENLVRTLRAAWESPERKKLEQEIESGLTELAATLKGEASSFRESQTGQRLKSDLDDMRQRVRSGEAAEKAREELIKALKLINTELEKAFSGRESTESNSRENEKPSQ
jgi:hypothetical protein